MFREQVTTVCSWFDRWSPCEQTVAMVAMLRKIQPTQARFLISVLNRQIADCTDVRRIEILSNDPNFVASLNSTESKEALMRDLLLHLPLLTPKNVEVKGIYLALIPKVLKYVLDHCTMIEEARQLLSYCLIHPAFTTEDRGLFATWLQQFDQLNATLTNNGSGSNSGNDQSLPGTSGSSHYPTSGGSPPSNELWQQQHSSLSGSPGNYGTNYQRIRRSNSLTPPVLHSDAWTSQEELCAPKPRSLSLSSEVSPQSSLASSGSGSETHLDDPRPTFTSHGMKDVPLWLKGLRLHKYSFLFAHLTFDEMLTLTEEGLEQQGVTKGARHKIVLSISKLRERISQLKQLIDQMTREKDSSLRQVLTDLKWILTTPIRPPFHGNIGATTAASTTDADDAGSNSGNSAVGGESSSGAAGTSSSTAGNIGPIGSNRPQASSSSLDEGSNSNSSKGDAELCTWIIHAVGKACEFNPDADCEVLLVSILDRCLTHEAFTDKQKRLVSLWRQQHASSARRNSVGHPHFHGQHHHRSTGSPAGSVNSSRHGSGTSASGGVARQFCPKVLNINNQVGTSSLGCSPWALPGNLHAMFLAKRPSLQDHILETARSHLAVQRTKSAPLPNFLQSGLSTSPPITQFDTLNPLVGGTAAADFIGLNFPESVSSLGLGRDTLGSLISHEHRLSGVGHDSSGFNQGQPGDSSVGQTMSAFDITSRLESLCLSMTEAAIGVPCTNY